MVGENRYVKIRFLSLQSLGVASNVLAHRMFLLLATGVAIGLVALRLFRPPMERAVASAPTGALRTPVQRRLHWASLACLLLPLGYIVAVDGTHFFPIVGALVANAAIMQALRMARLVYVARLWLIPPISALSAVIGAAVAAWPDLAIHSLARAPWPPILMASACVSLSTALSIWSFPVGFGERAT